MRTCQKELSFTPLYLLFDLAWIILVKVSYLYLPGVEQVFQSAVLLLLLFVFCITDIRFFLIPNWLLLVFTLPAIPIIIWGKSISMVDAGLGGLINFLLFYIVAVIGKKLFGKDALGGGDIKLAGVLGLFTGWQGIVPMLLIGSLSAIFVYGILIAWKRKKQPRIPFGPFLVFGSLLSLYLYSSLSKDIFDAIAIHL
ncbi:MAG: A24 family peptidase [Candidatus Zixiibacteriota bacterium]